MPDSDEYKTEVYTGGSWREPVDTKADLPSADDVDEGTMCYVRDESCAYVSRGGEWVVEIRKR